MCAAWRREFLRPGIGSEKQVLQCRPVDLLQFPPLVDGDEHSRFNATPGNDLGPVGEAGIKQLAEPRLRILNLPRLAHTACLSD